MPCTIPPWTWPSRRSGLMVRPKSSIGAGHAEYPIGKTYVLRRDFQKMRSELRTFANDGASRLVKRRARDGKRTRTAAKP